MLDNAGGRKFLVGLLVMALSTALLWFGRISPEEWVELLKWTVVGYLAANVGETVATSLTPPGPPPPPPPEGTRAPV